MTDLQVDCQIDINADAGNVWKALTDPDIIREYLFGTETISEWKEGSEIRFQGEYEGTSYMDKGIIKKIEPQKKLQYTYLSSFSGLEDKEENYQLITFELEPKNDHTVLNLRQQNILSEQSKEHSKQNWKMVLESMKEIVEKYS